MQQIHQANFDKRPEFMKKMGNFKKDFRAAIELSIPSTWKGAFQASKSLINRLSVIGSKTKQPALMVTPALNGDDKKLISQGILRHMGHGSYIAIEALEQGSLRVPERIVCKQGVVAWRVASFYREAWTASPPEDKVKMRLALNDVACPRCGERRRVRGCGRNKEGFWNDLRCAKCLNKNSCAELAVQLLYTMAYILFACVGR